MAKRRPWLGLLFLAVLTSAQAGTILRVSGFGLQDAAVVFSEEQEITPASVPETLEVSYLQLISARSEFGTLRARALVEFPSGGSQDSYAESSATDVVNAPAAGSIVIPIVLLGDVVASFGGQTAALFSIVVLNAFNDSAGEGVAVQITRELQYALGNLSEFQQTVVDPTSGAGVGSLAGYPSALWSGEIVLPLFAGDNTLYFSLAASASCFTPEAEACRVDTDVSRSFYLGPARYEDENGQPRPASMLVSQAGFAYSVGSAGFPAAQEVPGEIPEPSTWTLLALGLSLKAAQMRWKPRRMSRIE
jgi:hypothetical protein